MDKVSEKISKHYHFVGIGGIGMGGLASLLMAKGCHVSGSDLKENAIIQKLREQGAFISIGHDAVNVSGADCVVYSSAVPQDNSEIEAAKEKRIPLMGRAHLLSELMKNHCCITVAGSHGKTTTTAMVAQLLLKAGLEPTIAVGGVSSQYLFNARMGNGKFFVAELDESDGSFLYFSPYYSVITNIDSEHLDYYKDWDSILEAYAQFTVKTDRKGCLFGCGDDKTLRRLLQNSRRSFVTYGFSPENNIVAQRIEHKGQASSFDLIFEGQNIARVILNIPGRHNILNSLGAIAVGLKLGLKMSVITRSLEEYSGVQRRFQVKANVHDIFVVDDYGHHPTEIRATLNTARGLNPKRLVVVFQPHRYTRTKYLMDDFVESLKLSDYCIVTDIYAASEKPLDGISSQILFDKLKGTNGLSAFYLSREKILNHLLENLQPGDIVVIIGAGDIGHISDELSQKLNERYPQE